MDAARDSTTQRSNCTTAQTTATGNTDHGTPSATAAPSSTIMLATGRYPISEVDQQPALQGLRPDRQQREPLRVDRLVDAERDQRGQHPGDQLQREQR